MKARRADFAGNWYPSSASECEREIKFFLEEEQVKDHFSAKRIGGIVPHAGWYFSGSIACHVIHSLSQQPGRIRLPFLECIFTKNLPAIL